MGKFRIINPLDKYNIHQGVYYKVTIIYEREKGEKV